MEKGHVPVLLTVSDIQEIFKMKRSTAYKFMDNSCLPTIKIGRTRYVRLEDLNEFLKENVNREIII
ncbi:MAG: helix-turn-helix domain-containing protein [Marvinbryantia sp.]|jgi:hypothetical protein